MKKFTLILVIIITSINFSFSQSKRCVFTPFKVYLDDKDMYSSIRETPNGKIMLKINNSYGDGYIFNVIDCKGEWLKTNEIQGIDQPKISEFEGWVHTSIVGVSFTYSVDLLDKPNGKKVLNIKQESGETYKIIDVDCDWVKIKTKNGAGWVKSEKICGNPVTNCS